MIYFLNSASQLRRSAAALSVVFACLILGSAASAADLAFNVANGNFDTAGNWLDITNPIPVPAAAAPTVDTNTNTGDNAYIRNGGTATINNPAGTAATSIRVGGDLSITNPDYDNSGVVDAADYVLWRKGGPLANDATPADVQQEDYNWWRMRFGGTPLTEQIGNQGHLIWTAGEITGVENTALHTGGPNLQVGRYSDSLQTDFPGTVVQNGISTKIMLREPTSVLNIGQSGTTTGSGSSYTFNAGIIGTAIGQQNGISGANGDKGIRVKHGSFVMTGGSIVDATPADILAASLSPQRFLTVSDATGTANALNYASATLSGGTINSYGGMRVGETGFTKGVLNITGPITILTGGDTIIGSANTSIGEMNMYDGSLTVGRTDVTDLDPSTSQPRTTALIGRFQAGNNGVGTLNMYGGTIIANTNSTRVASRITAGGSAINMFGGSFTTSGLDIRNVSGSGTDLGGAVVVDGLTASFTQSGSFGSIIGNAGVGRFEVKKGTALLGGGGNTIQVGQTASSSSTINVSGGKLTLAGPLRKTTLAAVGATVNLTGGTLEWDIPTIGLNTYLFDAPLSNTGTGAKLITKLNALKTVQIGSSSPAVPANFTMTSGSWDLEIGAHTTAVNTFGGSDFFNVPNGTASLAGTLNISYINAPTFTGPNLGESFTIVKGSAGVSIGTVNITGSGSGTWVLDLYTPPLPYSGPPTEIRLRYGTAGSGTGGGLSAEVSTVPEPSSFVLIVFSGLGFVIRRRSRSRASA